MYRIVGGDGRQYGPVSAEQVREWVAQRRANGQTLVQAEGSTEWKPLAQFNEFAASVSSPGAPPMIDELSKSRLVAGLLGIILGGFGVHRFYLGYNAIGVAQILVTLFTCGIGWLWGLIEGILIITGSQITTDADGRPLKDP